MDSQNTTCNWERQEIVEKLLSSIIDCIDQIPRRVSMIDSYVVVYPLSLKFLDSSHSQGCEWKFLAYFA